MPKIIHLADVHIGKKFHRLGHKGETLREHIFKSFIATLKLAMKEKVDLVIIAGDLFDSNRVSPATVRSVTVEFQRISPIPVVILPGTHDCYDTQSVYRRKDWELCPNVRIFRGSQPETFTFPSVGIAVHGIANQSNKGPESPLRGLKPLENTIFNIAVAHGSFAIPGRSNEDDYLFHPDEIKQSGMSYIAFGHWHKVFNCSEAQTTAYYSGAPQQLSFSQGGGTVNLVNLNQEDVLVEHRSVRCSPWITLKYELPLNLQQLNDDLMEVPKEALVRISINGSMQRKEKESFSNMIMEWEDKFFHLEMDWTDSRVSREEFDITSFPKNTVGFHFIQNMSDRFAEAVGEEQELLEKAMHLGADYLLG